MHGPWDSFEQGSCHGIMRSSPAPLSQVLPATVETVALIKRQAVPVAKSSMTQRFPETARAGAALALGLASPVAGELPASRSVAG